MVKSLLQQNSYQARFSADVGKEFGKDVGFKIIASLELNTDEHHLWILARKQ